MTKKNSSSSRDGIGPEIMEAGLAVLEALASKQDLTIARALWRILKSNLDEATYQSIPSRALDSKAVKRLMKGIMFVTAIPTFTIQEVDKIWYLKRTDNRTGKFMKVFLLQKGLIMIFIKVNFLVKQRK